MTRAATIDVIFDAGYYRIDDIESTATSTAIMTLYLWKRLVG
jgi:hypothetical protein